MVVSFFSKKTQLLKCILILFRSCDQFRSFISTAMENEGNTAIANGGTTDTHSQVNGHADNVSRHSSRVGSARSGRSKAASLREAVTLDDAEGRKQSAVASQSPKPDVTTNGDRAPSPTLKVKPPSPAVPAHDAFDGDFQDDSIHLDDEHSQAGTEAIVC